ncbi:MAG TPA: PAS domain S-box protein, partial [Amaricoccus sp.]|nr:PAS domain S-box protein [Amaricoccus sp.]
MGIGFEEGRELTGGRFSACGPDGRRDVLVSTRVLRDAEERVEDVVAVVLVDDGGASASEPIDGARLAAIVASSSDAIISKTLDGRITSWNGSATRIFGYTADEMIGESVLRIIPPELHGQEAAIIDRLRRGERIEHFDTVRVGKDGRAIDVSLTISPLRNAAGQVVGASKIARDITQRKRAEALQAQLLDELTHRVNNTLATMQSIATLSLAGARDPASFVARFTGRLRALGVAHDLIVRGKMQGADLRQLLQEAVATPARLSGPDVVLDGRLVAPLALALDELAANAPAHRAGEGVAIDWQVRDGVVLELDWREPRDDPAEAVRELGARLAVIERVLAGVDGSVRVGQRFDVRLTLPLPGDGPRPLATPDAPAAEQRTGRRVLVVEDEALIAMDMEVQLTAAGWDVVGPAGTINEALTLIGATTVDAALVDANVRGQPVGEIAEALRARGVPF